MSEKITVEAQMPRGYKKLDGLEISQDGDELSVAGFIKLGESANRFQGSVALLYDPREMWGYPKEDQPAPEAESKAHKAAAKVVGTAATAAAAIKDKISTPSSESPAMANEPPAQVAKEQAKITTETADRPELSDELREYISQEIKRQVEERTKELQAKNDQLEAENKKLTERIQQLENDVNAPRLAADPVAAENAAAAEIASEQATPAAEVDTVRSVEAAPVAPAGETETVIEEPPTDSLRRGLLRRRSVTDREVRETNNRSRGLGALAVAAVAGAVVWELLEHKVFGHSPSREFRHHYQDLAQLKISEAKHNAADIKRDADILTGITDNAHAIAADKAQDAANHTAEMNAIAADKVQILARINDVHNSDLRAMHGILKQVHEINVHEHREAFGGHGGHATAVTSGETTQASLRYRGDTVWHEVSGRLRSRFGHNASKSQIAQATDRVLKFNGLRWNGGGSGVDAHKLPVGFHFKIPANIAQMFKR